MGAVSGPISVDFVPSNDGDVWPLVLSVVRRPEVCVLLTKTCCSFSFLGG